MGYKTQTEKFYKLIKKKRNEIKDLDISNKEKDELYLFTERITQKYEEIKKISLWNKVVVAKLNETQELFYKKLEEIISMTEIMNLEEIAKKQKENRKIFLYPEGYIPSYPFSNN
jgi:ribonucleotide reductase alpha subunit